MTDHVNGCSCPEGFPDWRCREAAVLAEVLATAPKPRPNDVIVNLLAVMILATLLLAVVYLGVLVADVMPLDWWPVIGGCTIGWMLGRLVRSVRRGR